MYALFIIWLRYNYLKIWNLKVQKLKMLRKFKAVQMKFLAIHITNQNLSFYVCVIGNVKISSCSIIFTNIFLQKRKIDNFDPFNVLLAIATNSPVLLKGAAGDCLQNLFCYAGWTSLHIPIAIIKLSGLNVFKCIYLFCGRRRTKKCLSNQNACLTHDWLPYLPVNICKMSYCTFNDWFCWPNKQINK